MMKFVSVLLLATMLMAVNACKNESTKLLQTVEKGEKEVVIPFKKFELQNGLTLVVHEDHSDPIVHVDVTYHVGSAREEIGKSGFAHFFEHMMFQGSENVADEEHFKIVTESGGTLNGTTNRDRTNYFETLPSNQLEIGLWLEADRMGFLLDAVTQEKFEIQRATVKNERGQRYDNRPYGLLGEVNSKNLYPYGHPYSWLTIGYIEDLNRVDVNDLKRFFMRWYGPNNATLTVGGDVNTDEVVKLVEKYFGSIPRGPEVQNMPKMVPTVESDRYVSYEDKIRFPLLSMTFPTVPQFHEDEPAIDCFSDILGGGQTSILYKNLVKNQIALGAFAFHPCSELSGEFTIQSYVKPGTKLDSIERIFRQSLLEFEQRGVTDEDVEKYKAQRESDIIYGLSTVNGKIAQLAAFNTYRGNPDYIGEELARYQRLTKEDVMAAYQKYIKGKASVIVSWLPEGGSELAAAEDNYEVDSTSHVAGPDEYAGLTYTKPVDEFDRSVRPSPGANPVVQVPDFWKENWDNGLKLIGTKSDEIPTVNIVMSINGGHRLLAEMPEKAGLASLTGDLMNESTEMRSSEEIAKALEMLGSSVSFSGGTNGMSMSIQSLKKNLDATLDIAKEMLFKPAFNDEDFDRVRNTQMEFIQNRYNEPQEIASLVYKRLMYGDESILGIPTSGNLNQVMELTQDDVRSFYQKSFTPANGEIVVVGDIERDEVLAKLDFLKTWEGEKNELASNGNIPSYAETKIYLVNKEGAAQSQIRIGYYTGMKYDPVGDYYKTYLMNYPLGGMFNSRINLNLREDKGYTYGARSSFSSNEYGGSFSASAGVKKDATAASIKEFMTEIQDYADNGIKDDELAFMQQSIGQREARNYESPFQKAGFLRKILKYNLDSDFVNIQNDLLSNATVDEINNIAKARLPYGQMIILVVGDKEVVLEELEELGYEIVELDKDGNPVAASFAKG